MGFDAIGMVRACYAPVVAQREWLEQLTRALGSVAAGSTSYAQAFDASDPQHIRIANSVACGPPPDWMHVLLPSWDAAPPRARDVMFADVPCVDLFSRRALRISAREATRLAPGWRGDRDSPDSLALIAGDGQRRGVCVGVLTPHGYRPPPRLVHELSTIASHLRSALRLRRRYLPGDGRVAASPPRPWIAAIHQAGDALHLVGGERAADCWAEVLRGRCSVIDQVEVDGRRWALVRRSAADLEDPVALTEREREIAVRAARGDSNKMIAYALGITTSCVSIHLACAERKLRLGSRAALIAFLRGPLRGAGAQP